ncbi:hypothetical protein POX_d06132 [Penicillium oxalicum]|uniref:hypothetical protein n=1 Tax=Penicillium oxalicum TaxID=69781 RepID=UPI0020B64E4D|nr:hypothetical protein POX_d06132 [Penicillium oxalicum]KAI2790611.1 hypothetical protein POX_d06132 [Penicillium oxalicum]
MNTPPVTEVEIIYDRESESPLPHSVIDLSFTQRAGKKLFRKSRRPRVPLLGDGLDLEDPMVSSYAETGGEIAQDEKAAMDPFHILNGKDRLGRRTSTSPETQGREERPDEEDRSNYDLLG